MRGLGQTELPPFPARLPWAAGAGPAALRVWGPSPWCGRGGDPACRMCSGRDGDFAQMPDQRSFPRLECDLKTGLYPQFKLPKPFPHPGVLFYHFLTQLWVSGRTLLASL